MKINNQSDFDRNRGQLFFVVLFFMTLIALGVIYDFYTTIFFPIPSWVYSIFFGILFIIYLFWRSKKVLNKIFYDDETDPQMISIRFYSMNSLFPNYEIIKIPKKNFYKFEIRYSEDKKKEYLILFQQTKQGMAKYKPLLLTGINQQFKKEFLKALNEHAKVKNSLYD